MKIGIPAVATVLFVSGHARAASTEWVLRVTYPDGTVWTTRDASTRRPIVPWTGSSWRCQVSSTSLAKNGKLISGIWCTTGNRQSASVYAQCSATSADRSYNSAVISDEFGSAVLSVECGTTEEVSS